MKTTIDLPDALLEEAKAEARRRQTTLRALLEEALRSILTTTAQAPAFKLRDGSVRGQGLQPPFDETRWEDVRAAIYEGRGG